MICPSCGSSTPPNMRYCGMCGSPLLDSAEQSAPRERRRVSVVFIDLASFSTLTHGFDPEELRDLADEILTVVAGIIEDYDGYVDAFRGDGLIALFGAPHSHPDDPQRAVLAATAGIRAIETIGESKGFPLKGRAGVNTGIVIAGAIGSGRVRDYTVMGSPVNLAARLEAAATPGEVWVGPETYEATHHLLLYETTPEIELAGFPNIRHAYKLISTHEKQETDPYMGLAFIGRERERRLLKELYEEVVTSRSPREVWLVGEAGSGKTRLLREFLKDLSTPATRTLWIEGKPTSTFSWEPLARQLFDLGDGQDPRLRKNKVLQVLTRVLPNEPRWHQQILSSLQLAETKPWTRLERRAVNRTNLAWRDLIARLPEQEGGPEAVVLVIENSPRDTLLMEFLALLQQASSPILTIRTSRGRGLPAGDNVISLQPLSLQESLDLLTQLASPILRVATHSLVYQVGGVPAYILELGRALSITQEGSFSGSLASLLQARLDMLEISSRQLLARAALAGERCWEGLLQTLSTVGEGQEVKSLIQENLLVKEARSSIAGEIEYRFQSELLRHAALRMVPFGERPKHHLRIAAWLEQHAPLTLSELIAHHFQAGGSPEAAYPHFLAAADLATSQRDEAHAFEIFEKIFELELPVDQLAQATLAYAQAALSEQNNSLACEQLKAAARLIETCPEATRHELQNVHDQLHRDLQQALQ